MPINKFSSSFRFIMFVRLPTWHGLDFTCNNRKGMIWVMNIQWKTTFKAR